METIIIIIAIIVIILIIFINYYMILFIAIILIILFFFGRLVGIRWLSGGIRNRNLFSNKKPILFGILR